VLENEIRITMAQTASYMGALTQVPQPPSRATYQQFIERVVGTKIIGEDYSVEIVYVAYVGPEGQVLNFAYNPQAMELRDPQGAVFRSRDLNGARELLAQAESKSLVSQGLVHATAYLGGSPDTGERELVDVGYRRAIAAQAVNRLRSRDSFLALALIGLGIVLAIRLAGPITGPVERLTAAMRRVQRGDLEVSVLPETTDEIG
jgi:HAMP domain-containing protein